MTLTGDTLRIERLRRGWTLEQVAAETKIGLHLLEAIEDDQLSCLPCGMLARSFVRQYAHTLGMDEDKVVASLKRQLEESAAPMPEPGLRRKSARIPYLPPLNELRRQLASDFSLGSLVLPALLIFTGLGIYNSFRHGWQTAGASVVLAPKAASSGSSERVASDIGIMARPVQPPAPVRPFRTESSSAGSSSAPSVADGVHVALTATEPVWISINSDGTRVHSGMLDALQTLQFGATNKMMVTAGNAGGLVVSLNGKPVGPIGPHGEVRQLELTKTGAHIVPRAKPAAPEHSTAPEPPPPAPGASPITAAPDHP